MTEVLVALIGQSAVLVPLLIRASSRAGTAARRAEAAEAYAAKASAQTVNTGNGFAAGVLGALDDIKAEQRHMRRDVGGLREEVRTERRERGRAHDALAEDIAELRQQIIRKDTP